MATTQKKPASQGKRKTASTSSSRKKAPAKRPIRREVGGVACLLLALCVAIGYFQTEGWLIALLPTCCKGLVGWGYYLMAPALAVAAYILLFHKGRPVVLRTVCILLSPVMLGSICHLLLCEVSFASSVGIIPRMWSTGVALESGGVLSGILAHAFRAVFGNIASLVIFILILVALLAVVFHQGIAALWRRWQQRERLAYEMEDVSAPSEPVPGAPHMETKARNADPVRPAAQERTRIDIPLDDVPEKKRPGILKGFFRQKSRDQLTPDQVLSEEPARQETKTDMTMDSPFVDDTLLERDPGTKHVPNPPAEPFADAPVPSSPPPAPAARQTAAAQTSAAAVEEPAQEEPRRTRRADARAEVEQAAAQVSAEIGASMEGEEPAYSYPPITLLNQSSQGNPTEAGAELRTNAQRLADTLTSFGVDATPGDVIRGPAVTRYEFVLDQGVKLSKITNLADDIALALGAGSVRIAPVPDKISVVGIEVPNKHVSAVPIRDVLESRAFVAHKSCVAFVVGRDIANQDIIGDIAKLPHVLIAGTTGSGKSVCTNSLIVSLLYKSTPEEVRFIMVDPKMVELAPYNGIPHLLIPVVTDPKKAAGALQWAVYEMMKRYKTFSEMGVKKLEEYNHLAAQREDLKKMPTVVVVIDELADLMLVAAKEVEESICRVAQMGRAAGIHLVIATQRPSADVITGLMKANIPSRIAFAVASSLESRIILDTPGAEKLVGRGDMLYAPLGEGKPRRVQGCFITPEEIERVVAFVKQSGEAEYSDEVMQKIEEAMAEKEKGGGKKDRYDGSTTAAVEEMEGDELFPAAVEVVLETGMASVSMLQRRLKLGYSRAARLVDQMEERGVVGPFEGSKPRQVLITKEQWQELQMKKDGALPAAENSTPPSDAPWDEE